MTESSMAPWLRSRLIRLAVLGLLAAILVPAVAITASKLAATDQDRLRQRSEASLYYPGSVLLREGGSDTQPFSVAGIWKQLATEASTDDVLAFYRREFAALGWMTGGGSSTITGTHETQACAWHTDDLVIRVSFWNMDKFAKQYPDDPGYTTVYEIRLINHGLSASALACSPP